MKEFRVQYRHFFQGARTVDVLAGDKPSALIEARRVLEERGDFFGGNIDTSSFRVVAQRVIDKQKWKAVRDG